MIKTASRRLGQRFAWVVLGIFIAFLLWFSSSRLPFLNSKRHGATDWVPISSSASLLHVGSRDSFAITQDGIQAARLVLEFLQTGKVSSAEAASRIYDRIIPLENYGGEYTALQWFCQLLTDPPAERERKLSDPFIASFYQFFARDNFAPLQEYLQRKYKLAQLPDEGTETGANRLAFLEDSILFNNPRREEWEKTSKILEILPLKPGQTIADIGSGPGYYTFKFADAVGNTGKVLAIDTVQNHLNYIKQLSEQIDRPNIETVNNDPGKTIGLSVNQEVDMAFMCSLYHVIYAESSQADRTSFVESIYKALKPGGRFVIVDNALVPPGKLPYHGPYIAKELIVGQLKHYGFRLVADRAFVPQRYVLVFEKTPL